MIAPKLPIIHNLDIKKMALYIALPHNKEPDVSLAKSFKAIYLLRMLGYAPLSPIAHTAPFHYEYMKQLNLKSGELAAKMNYEQWDIQIMEQLRAGDYCEYNEQNYDSGLIILLDIRAINNFNIINYYNLSYDERREFLLDKSNWYSTGCYGEVKWAIDNHIRVIDLDFLMNSNTILNII